ncbi:MAG: hypothetical protein J7J02_04480 [Sulfurovum sp.]|nr:hypothetical protein [Sulfurovum sp.]
MMPSVLSSQLIRGTKYFLSSTFPSSTPAFFDMMDKSSMKSRKSDFLL